MRNSQLLVLCLMTAVAPAQDRERAFDLRYLFAEGSDIWPAAEQDPHTRLRCLMQLAAPALLAVDATAKMELFEQRRFLLVVGDPAKTGALGRTLTELSRSVTRPMQLQISLIRLTAKLAARHGIAAGIQSEVKDDDLTLLLRDVQAEGGALAHVPETNTGTMQLFKVQVPERFTLPGDRQPRPKLVLRGQALPVGDSAAFRFEIAETPRGDARPAAPLELPVMNVAVGKSALSTTIKGEQAIVLWLRLVAMGPAETRQETGK